MFDMFDICHILVFIGREKEGCFQSFPEVHENVKSALTTIYFNVAQKKAISKGKVF